MGVKTIIKPVIEEVGKFGETASSQVTGSDSNSAGQTKEVVKDIYKPMQDVSSEKVLEQKAVDQKELEKKRAQLRAHQQYFQPFVNPQKPKEEPKAEKIENEEKKKRWELAEKEKKKPPPLAVQRAQKVEKYPGASG